MYFCRGDGDDIYPWDGLATRVAAEKEMVGWRVRRRVGHGGNVLLHPVTLRCMVWYDKFEIACAVLGVAGCIIWTPRHFVPFSQLY